MMVPTVPSRPQVRRMFVPVWAWLNVVWERLGALRGRAGTGTNLSTISRSATIESLDLSVVRAAKVQTVAKLMRARNIAGAALCAAA